MLVRRARWMWVVLAVGLLVAGCRIGPGQETAEKALAEGTALEDLTQDWLSTGHEGDNPSSYPIGFADLREVTFGIDDKYLYIKATFGAPWPKTDADWPILAGDQVTGVSFDALVDIDNDRTTGCLSDNGAEIFAPAGCRLGGQYWNNYAEGPSGIETPEGQRYLYKYGSADRHWGGPGYDYIINAYPLVNLNLKAGQEVTLSLWVEAESMKYHHASFDPLGGQNAFGAPGVKVKLGEKKALLEGR